MYRDLSMLTIGRYVTLEHKTSLKSMGYIYRNSQKIAIWVKIIDFYCMPKIIRISRSCSIRIFCKCLTINISKLNYWLVICIAKNLIWTNLKAIFLIFRFFLHPQIPDFQIFVSIHQWKALFSFQMMYKSQFKKKITLKTLFMDQGHIWLWSIIAQHYHM